MGNKRSDEKDRWRSKISDYITNVDMSLSVPDNHQFNFFMIMPIEMESSFFKMLGAKRVSWCRVYYFFNRFHTKKYKAKYKIVQ
jgi:hypothetical protein